jgi:hypothetical protein
MDPSSSHLRPIAIPRPRTRSRWNRVRVVAWAVAIVVCGLVWAGLALLVAAIV